LGCPEAKKTRLAFTALSKRTRHIVHGDCAKSIAFGQIQHPKLGPADPHCIFQHGLENRFQLTRGRTNDP
jgi:hypothetical protein